MKFLSVALTTFTVLSSLIGVKAIPTGLGGTPTVERRAYVSNGVTCYYQCPETVTDEELGPTTYSSTGTNGDNTVCNYATAGSCSYNTVTGAFVEASFITDCPAQAPEGGCGEQPDRGFKKRNTYNLGRAHDDRAITDRQYKYRKAAAQDKASDDGRF